MTIVRWRHNTRYGVEESYKLGMGWLKGCSLVEDWGCALCHARQYRVGDYLGVDGTAGKADVIADLSTYGSDVPGVFMRHVLEHNVDWRVILDNALRSFRERMALILFRPLADADVRHPTGHVNIDLCGKDLVAMVLPYLRDLRVIPSGDAYDTVLLLEKA